MKKICLAALFSLLSAQDPKPLTNFVYKYLLITQSKMVDSPTVWQDVREGYLRSEGLYFSEALMDSIDTGLSSYHVAVNHIPTVEQLRREVKDGKEFDYKIDVPPPPMANVNYFSSSKK